jgi:hypothetical protein
VCSVGGVEQLFQGTKIKHIAAYWQRIRHSESWDIKLVKLSNYSTGHVDTKTEIINIILMEHFFFERMLNC